MEKIILSFFLLGVVFSGSLVGAQAQDGNKIERVFNTLTAEDPTFLEELNYLLNGFSFGRARTMQQSLSVNTLVAAGYSVKQLMYFEVDKKHRPCVIEVKFVGPNQKEEYIYFDALTAEMKLRCQP